MELGGNKYAQAFFEENGMFKDGKPDHEHALHSRHKMELSAKAEAAIREEMKNEQPSKCIIVALSSDLASPYRAKRSRSQHASVGGSPGWHSGPTDELVRTDCASE